MTVKKNHPQITQILFLICVICVICGPAFAQTSSDRWIDYAAGDYDIFPNVTYAKASNFELKLDLYLPKNRTRPNATLILFHGGGWVDGQKERNVLFLLPYLELGWSAVNVEYRTARQAPAPAAVEDCRCALRWLTYRARDYSLDTSRFVLTGTSAGGHLALMTGMLPANSIFDRQCPIEGNNRWGSAVVPETKVAAVVNWFGIGDVADLVDGPNARNYAREWFGSLSNPEQLAKQLSPVNYVRAGLPPIITIHGEHDDVAPYNHSVRLHSALDKAGVPNRLVTIKGRKHGGFNRQEMLDSYTKIREFLRQQGLSTDVNADDGYRLWLRYDQLPVQRIKSIVVEGKSATFDSIRRELSQVPVRHSGNVSVVVRKQQWDAELKKLGPEGFRIRTIKDANQDLITIASTTDIGALYGAFHFLRLLQTGQPIDHLQIDQKPALKLRLLNHWDNLDRSIERGYAGKSLWNWDELPDKVDPRLHDYARANASIGINGAVLNNVNANAEFLTPKYLDKVAAVANVFRPFGIRVYLSARFSAPIELGKLPTADPLDRSVIDWWKQKANEIYKVIPDFGGFLVKANSEGQPGPRTYNRSHVDGANMLAAALAPHQGIVMWRAFVYDMKDGYDRAGAAYENLQPFDGKFAPNVLLQVKNGPIDFQPREPFHPLFGAMPRTQLMPELQITQEYLGFSNHFVFLASMWREFLDADTYARGRGSTVSRVADGTLYRQPLTGIAGVANTGTDRNWTGHHLLQANWYAFGRLAWNPRLSSEQIAQEWIRMTLTHDAGAVAKITALMLASHDAVVNYMTPLGLHHLMWGGHHYGPAPWWDKEKRDDWNPVYYHKANNSGIGFDRTKTGSNSVSQYHLPVSRQFSDVEQCPEKFLLWFHHVSWDHKMKSGRTLWDELALRYQSGVDWVKSTRATWATLAGAIDRERHAEISQKLAIQERDAAWWRDASLLYFQTFSSRPLPVGVEPPAKTLAEYKAKALEW